VNDRVMAWAAEVLTPDMVKGKDVLEAGSLDVNGSLRPMVMEMEPASYLGIDIQEGPGVDVVCPAERAWAWHRRFHLVICTEMLEHTREWQRALWSLARCLRPGGWLLLTTRSPGFEYHPYPEDHWRFTSAILWDALNAMGCWNGRTFASDDRTTPGVFLLARRGVNPARIITTEAFPAPIGGSMKGDQ